MKILQSKNPWRQNIISRVSKTLSFSTTITATLANLKANSLYRMIAPLGDPRVSIVPVLDQWIEEGRDIKHIEIVRLIKQLRSYKRFKHALELSEWMSYRKLLDLSPGDMAIRLDLVSKVRGIKEAEKYFDSIPESSRVLQVYGALLNCYAHSTSVEKAENLLQKMKELGYVKTLAYNAMIKIYSQMKNYEKIDNLMQEMENKGIHSDIFTYTTRLNAFAVTSNILRMEELLKKMENDSIISIDWHCYVVAANGYLKAGLPEKASISLKKAEKLLSGKNRRFGYEIILTVYTSLGNKDEVYRIWDLYKNIDRINNSGYICMISSLMKLNDHDGVQKIYKDWESGTTSFDIRIPNLVVTTYCMRGDMKKAKALINNLVNCGKELNASTWDRLAKGYYLENQLDEAVETLKKTVSAKLPASGWKPERATFGACLNYLKGKGDIGTAEELIRLFRESKFVPVDIFDRLLIFIKDVDCDSNALDQMQMGGINEARDEKLQGVEVC